MTEDDDAALSGLIDGTLDAAEVARIETRLAAEPALRAQLDQLAALDDAMRDLGTDMAFMPDVALPGGAAAADWTMRSWTWLAGLGALLVAIRLMPKLPSLATVGMAVQLIAIAIILTAIVRMAGLDQDDPAVRV